MDNNIKLYNEEEDKSSKEKRFYSMQVKELSKALNILDSYNAHMDFFSKYVQRIKKRVANDAS